MKKFIKTTITEYFNSRFINEAYDDVSMDYIKSRKKLWEYYNYDDKLVIGNNTYLNFLDKNDWFLWGSIYVFDNTDGTEIANSSYGKQTKSSPMKASIDVRNDKRRLNIASNIYEWIEKLTNYKLYPETNHSNSAEEFWNNPKRKFGFDK